MNDIFTPERPVEGCITSANASIQPIQNMTREEIYLLLFPEKYDILKQDIDRLKDPRLPAFPKELEEKHPKIIFACKELHTAYKAFSDAYFQALRTIGDDDLTKTNEFFSIDINTLDIDYKNVITTVIMLHFFQKLDRDDPTIVEEKVNALREIFEENTKMVREKFCKKSRKNQ